MSNIDIAIGTSTAAANTAINSAVAGDFIRFERGGSWLGMIDLSSQSGSLGNILTIASYGSGAKPILKTRDVLPGWDTGGNWTDMGGNVWRKALAGNSSGTNYRVWLDGTEYPRSINSAGVNSTRRTSHNVANGAFLYVYATSNPATFYTLIEYSGTDAHSLKLSNSNYITVQNLDIRGGHFSSIYADFVNHIIIEDCEVGYDSPRTAIAGNGTTTDVIIRRNTIDSSDRITDDFESDKGVNDGIRFGGGSDGWKIYHNWVRDWGHSCIEMSNISTVQTSITNTEIYENYITAEFVNYCRGIGFDSLTGRTCTGNKIYRNYIYRTRTRCQLNAPNLEFYYNIINETLQTTTGDATTSGGIDIAGYSNTSPIDMKIYNNVIANCYDMGLRLNHASTYGAMQGNLIRNNIFFNNGLGTAFGLEGFQIVVLPTDGNITGNTFENNLLYCPGYTDVYYDSRNTGNTGMTIAEFNARNGTNSDVMSGNITGDPLFVDNDSNFALQPGSPALNVGLDLGSPYDVGLIASAWPNDVNTGLQVGLWNLGAYVEDSDEDIKILVHSGKILTHAGKILTRAIPI